MAFSSTLRMQTLLYTSGLGQVTTSPRGKSGGGAGKCETEIGKNGEAVGLPYGVAVLPTAPESPLVYACELWVFAMCPALRGSTVSYAGDAHFPKHSLEYSLNF